MTWARQELLLLTAAEWLCPVIAGKNPNVNNLGLEAAGVQYDHQHGVTVRHPVKPNLPL